MVGVPGQIVVRSKPRHGMIDLNHNQLPDTIGESLVSVMNRLEAMESKVHMLVRSHQAGDENGNEKELLPHPPDHGMWRGEDFMI